jgi:DNA polymerase III epsilon subunit-like protein
MILFFDTETTGTPKDYRAPATDSANWPHIVQIGWILEDDDKPIESVSYVIMPRGFTIPIDAIKIHGITNAKAELFGCPLKWVLEKFAERVAKADTIIGHNISFDISMIRAELARCEMTGIFIGKRMECTMMSSTNFCKLPEPTASINGLS